MIFYIYTNLQNTYMTTICIYKKVHFVMEENMNSNNMKEKKIKKWDGSQQGESPKDILFSTLFRVFLCT